ncbi:hypothetical protein DL93DRAFT_1095112 [Clavulina sp. PMI_390]|nr:hypothetical protein DL93DRAFT_1095112 [Clavulina sp. PMI_390]
MQDPVSVLSSELALIIIKLLLATAEDSPPANLACLSTVTAISSRWRNLAIGYGPLWENIYVKLSKPPAARPRNSSKLPTRLHANDIDRVRCFLHRSNQSPIRLFIPQSWAQLDIISEEERLAYERNWKLMDDLLAPHMDRCCSISVLFRGERGQAKLPLLLQPWNFTLLRELVIDNRYPSASEESLLWDETWNLSPQLTPLRTLKFSHSQRYLPKALDAPWPLLFFIDLAIPPQFWPRVCETLSELPSLKELRISLECDSRGTAPPSNTLQTRVSLPLVECVATNYPAIWADICTPSLCHAVFTPGVFYPSLHGGGISRAYPKLTELLAELPVCKVTISGGDSGAPVTSEVLSVLRPFKRVKSLQFRQSTTHGKVVGQLAQLIEQNVMEMTTQASTNTNTTQETGSIDSLLPLLEKISIEEPKDRYWIFWDFPHLSPQPPYSFTYSNALSMATEASREKRAYCDRCRRLMLHCDLGSKPGVNCAFCTEENIDCTLETNLTLVMARQTQQGVNHLQSLGFDVAWVLI